MIFITAKNKEDQPPLATPVFTQVRTLDPPYPDVKALIASEGQPLPPSAIKGDTWTLTSASTAARIAQMRKDGIPLGEYVNGQIYRGILTGFNEAFIINGETRQRLIDQDPNSAEIIKPFAVGDDIRRWHIRDKDRWLIRTEIEVNIKRYPAIFKHLKRYQPQLEARQDQGNHWWELRSCSYYPIFSEPKILFPEICSEPRFAFSGSALDTNNKVFVIPGKDYFLLAVLNSTVSWEFAKTLCTVLGDENHRGRLMLQWVNFKNLPIPQAERAQKADIAKLAKYCLDRGGEECEDLQRDIDERVAALYGL